MARNPALAHHAVQVELNRGLYMDESTKKLCADLSAGLSAQLLKALELVLGGIAHFK
jgi:N-formylglutamate amidohydrolase